MNDVNRESILSTESEYSADENDEVNCLNTKRKNAEQQFSWTQQILFCGPLILCLILLITGIIIFIIAEQRKRKNQEFGKDDWNTVLDDISPISCPLRFHQQDQNLLFIWDQCLCALNRSVIFEITFEHHRTLKYHGEHIHENYLINSPKVHLNQKYLSKIQTQSFLLIVVPFESNSIYQPRYSIVLPLYWIKYYSSLSNQVQDICENTLASSRSTETVIKVFLLYATNSSQTMIRAKTYCTSLQDVFSLINYVELLELKLIASTYFKYVPVEIDDYE